MLDYLNDMVEFVKRHTKTKIFTFLNTKIVNSFIMNDKTKLYNTYSFYKKE